MNDNIVETEKNLKEGQNYVFIVRTSIFSVSPDKRGDFAVGNTVDIEVKGAVTYSK